MNASKPSLDIFYEHADIRIRDKPFMGTPYAIASVYLVYVIFIAKILPKIMENRKPLNYRKWMAIVDILLWLRSLYFLTFLIYGFFFYAYNWKCQPYHDQQGTWQSEMEVEMCYQFLISKFLYILQSVVFVTCKKNKSVGNYLLIHHSTFPLMIWGAINYYPGGHVTFTGLINSLVHFTGTTNRLLSAVFHDGKFPKFAKIMDVYMHIFQFVACFGHSAQLLFQPNCSVPKSIAIYEMIGEIYIACLYNYFVLNSKKRQKNE